MSKNNVAYGEIISELFRLSTEAGQNVGRLCPPNVYLRDYRTIGIRTPRQTGLTHYQRSQLAALEDCIWVVFNNPIREAMINNIPVFGGEPLTGTELQRLLTKEQVLGMALCHKREPASHPAPLTIMIDMASRYTDLELDMLYEWAASSHGKETLFILFN